MPKKEIFVSSTFKDFQTERDLLNNDFSNIINDTLKNKIGTTISFLDLRYGVNTYGNDEGQRLKSATISSIQNVKKTKPFFIIFIGNRYGSLVDDESLSAIYKFFMNSYDQKTKSITEVEFDFSSFNSDLELERSHCFLIKRNIINDNNNSRYYDENQSLVNDLLVKIKAKCASDNYLEYDSFINTDNHIEIDLENRNKIVNFLLTRFISLLDNNLSDSDIEQNIFNSIYENENYTYIEGDETKYIHSIINENKFLSIEGKPGYGKTALVCRLAQKVKSNDSYSYFFLTKNSITRSSLARVLRYFLRSLLIDKQIEDKNKHIENLKDLELISYFYEKLNTLNENIQYYFFIDDVDRLSDYKDNHHPIDSLLVPNNCHFIFTSNSKINTEANIIIENVRINDIKAYFLKRALAIGKLLPDKFLNELSNYKFSNQNLFRNPLYLSMVLDNILALNENDFILLNNNDSFEEALSDLLFNKISEHSGNIEEELHIMLNKLESKNSKAILSSLALFDDVSITDLVNYFKHIKQEFLIDDFYYIRNVLSNIITKNYNGKYALYNDLFKPIILDYYYYNDNNSIASFKYQFLKYGILNSPINNKIDAYSIIKAVKDIEAYDLLLKHLDFITNIDDNRIVHNVLGDCIIQYTLLEVVDNPNDNLIYNLLNCSEIINCKKAFNYLSIYLLKEELEYDYLIKNSIKINEFFMNLCNDITYLSAPTYKMGLTIYLLSYSYLLNFNDSYVEKGIDFCNQFLKATGMSSYAIKIINLDFKRIQKCHNIKNLKEKIDFIPMVYQYLASNRPSLSDIIMFMDTIGGVWDSLISIDINTYYKNNFEKLNSLLNPLLKVTNMLNDYVDKIKDFICKGDYYKYKISFCMGPRLILGQELDENVIEFLYNLIINGRMYLVINQSVFNALELLIYKANEYPELIDINFLIKRVINLVDDAIIHQANDIEVLKMIPYIYKTLFSMCMINDVVFDIIIRQYNDLLINYSKIINKCIYPIEYNKLVEELIFINVEVIIIKYCRGNNIDNNIFELQNTFNKIPDDSKEKSKQIILNNLNNYKYSIKGVINSTNTNITFDDIFRLFITILNK